MADPIDIANDRAAAFTENAERRARGKSGPESHPDFDGTHCVDCGEEIPAPRLALGKVRDVECQQRLERGR